MLEWMQSKHNNTTRQTIQRLVFITINLKKKKNNKKQQIKQYQIASSSFQLSDKVGGRQSFISTAGFSHCCREYLNKKSTAVSSFLLHCTARGYSFSWAGALLILSIISAPLAKLATWHLQEQQTCDWLSAHGATVIRILKFQCAVTRVWTPGIPICSVYSAANLTHKPEDGG